MPKRRDLLLIALVIVLAAVLLGVSRMMPGSDLSTKKAEVTLAPDAIEYVTTPEMTPEMNPQPATEATAEPATEATVEPATEATAEPATEATAEPATEATAEPATEATVEPTIEATAEPENEATAEPAAESTAKPEQKPETAGPMMPAKVDKVRGYVVLNVGGRQYGDPIAMDRDKIITIKQDDGKINRVHITPEKVYMESSNCENQDCVGQGEVHVDTYKQRILSTYIICLPNSVSIEMIPVED